MGCFMSSLAYKIDDGGIESCADELKPGTQLLRGQFTIESSLNAGGFGITYLAKDSLYRRVVIKECFPSSFCRRTGTVVAPSSRQRQEEYRSVIELFKQEALNLSKLVHPNIVKVHQIFEDNGTAYMAMDHIQGPDLLETIEGTAPRLTSAEIIKMLHKMLDALGYVHAQGFLHRDISPDNMLLDRHTGEPVLIDFGAARKDVTRKSRALSGLRVVKDGYSPQEFYVSGSKQAPSSDLYALAASFCHLVSGEVPKTSHERLSSIANREGDPQRPLVGRIKGYPLPFLAAIDKAMSIFPRDRLQSVAEWQAMLRDPDKPAAKTPPVENRQAVTATPESDRPAAVRPNVPADAPPMAVARGSRDLLMSSAAAIMLLSGLLSLPPDALDRARQLGATVLQAGASSSVVAESPSTPAEPFALQRVVRLPYQPGSGAPDQVAGVLPWSPDWMKPGIRIVEVNGSPVQNGAAVQAMLADGADLATLREIRVIFGYQVAPGADVVRKMETLPVVDQLRLPGGLTFDIVATQAGTQTVVAALPTAGGADLLVGDVLVVYSSSGEKLGTAIALADILKRELTNKVATYGFAVQRNGSMTVGSFQLASES